MRSGVEHKQLNPRVYGVERVCSTKMQVFSNTKVYGLDIAKFNAKETGAE